MLRRSFIFTVLVLTAVSGTAADLVLPVFAHNLPGRHEDVWSSELYLTNPTDQPVMVEIARFLPGQLKSGGACDQSMSLARVVPPQSATVWTASGLGRELGCAETARGGLVLRADGQIHVSSRLVNLSRSDADRQPAVLTGRGEAFEAVPLDALPGPGTYLLPALMWHRHPCDEAPLFETVVGFANPGSDAVPVVLDVPHEEGRGVLLDGERVYVPHELSIPGGSWRQFRLMPVPDEGGECGGVESFLVRLELGSPIAVYGSVIDRSTGDPRTVSPVPLNLP